MARTTLRVYNEVMKAHGSTKQDHAKLTDMLIIHLRALHDRYARVPAFGTKGKLIKAKTE